MDEGQCKTAIANCRKILSPNGILIGRNLGSEKGKEHTTHPGLRFLHSPESLKELLIASQYVENSIDVQWTTIDWQTETTKMRFISFYARAL